MYKKGAGNDKQEKDAGNRTLCPYRNFSQAIIGVTQNMTVKIKNPSETRRSGQINKKRSYNCVEHNSGAKHKH